MRQQFVKRAGGLCNHSLSELLENVQVLRESGYSDDELATKVGVSLSYLQNLLVLV
jgi:ParB family transcriptional regulator, chromosome partitioning protein